MESPAGLTPRKKAETIEISAYKSDIEVVRRLLKSLNSSVKDGEYTEEDLFSFMAKKALDCFPEHQHVLNSSTRKRRKKEANN